MASWYGEGWQIIDRADGRLIAQLVWDRRRKAWHCDCAACGCGGPRCVGQEPCLHQRMLEVLEVQPPRPPSGQVAPGTVFDPLTQKGY